MLRLGDYTRDLRPTEWGSGVSLQGSNPELRISAMGQKRTSEDVQSMSVLPPKADIGTHSRDVCLVPKADIASVNHLVGALLQEQRHVQPKSFRSFKIDRHHESLERMSALPPIADIGTQAWNVRFVPTDSCTAAKVRLFDYFVGEA